MFVATLIAAGGLTRDTVAAATAALDAVGCAPAPPVWIDDGDAADVPFARDPDAARAALADMTSSIDIAVQPAAGRAKRLILADMDSTMITVECIDELADYAGIKPQIAAITERAMQGQLDFRAALTERVGLLAGLSETVLADCLEQRVHLMPGARTLVQTMTAHGARAVLVSGGFMPFAGPVAARIGFDRARANELEIVDGRLTGRVIEPIVDSATKLDTLHAECAALGITTDAALAVGDGANDVPMLVAAGLGVAYRAHAAAVAAADAAVRHGDLTALLWMQGYPRASWRD